MNNTNTDFINENNNNEEWCEEHEQIMWKNGLKCGGCLDDEENKRIGQVYRALYDNNLLSKNADFLTKYLIWYEKTNGTADEFVEYVKTIKEELEDEEDEDEKPCKECGKPICDHPEDNECFS